MPSDGSEFLFEKTLWGIKWLDQKLGGGFWPAKSLDLGIKSLYELKPLRKHTIKTSNRLVP
jgi:hypothetical protein